MPDTPNYKDLLRVARDEILSRDATLSKDVVEREGTDANVLLAAMAAMGEEVSSQLADVVASLYLDSATGNGLKRLVYDRYGLTPKPAAPALGTVAFYTDTAAAASFTIPINTTVATPDGKQFLTTEAVSYPMGSSGPVYAQVRSSIAGSDQQVAGPDEANPNGFLTTIVSSIPSAPGDLHVKNLLATSGADDEEEEDSLRDRARRFFSAAKKATVRAIETAALAVPGVRKATAFEVLDSVGRPARYVSLVVSDRFTETLATVTSGVPSYATQSQALAGLVQNGLGDTRPAGTYVQVIVGQVVLQPVVLALTFQAGYDTSLAALQARVAIINYTNGLAPGIDWTIQGALEALSTVPGLAYTGNEILSPVGNVAVNPLQVIRTQLSLVTATGGSPDQPVVLSTNPDLLPQV
jgi:hypothetical protein